MVYRLLRPIRMRVVYAGQRVEFTTGHRIDISKWDVDRQRVKNGCTNKLKQSASEINSNLLKYSTILQDIFKEYEVLETNPSISQLKNAFNQKCKVSKTKEDRVEIISFAFDEFINENSVINNWAESTMKKLKTVKKHLKDFDINLTFTSLTEDRISDYVNYLRIDKDMRNTTIGKQVNLLKWFLRWAVKKGYTENIVFEKFKPKLKTTQKKSYF